MPWWTWLALGVFVLSLLALAILGVYAVGRLRRARVLAETLQTRVDELARNAEELERRMEHAQARAEEVQEKQARLQASLDRLSVLTWALSDATKSVTRVREAYLRK
jgi:predicted nuclease with TOPRIM domain